FYSSLTFGLYYLFVLFILSVLFYIYTSLSVLYTLSLHDALPISLIIKNFAFDLFVLLFFQFGHLIYMFIFIHPVFVPVRYSPHIHGELKLVFEYVSQSKTCYLF